MCPRPGVGSAAGRLLEMAKAQGFCRNREIVRLYAPPSAGWARCSPSLIPPRFLILSVLAPVFLCLALRSATGTEMYGLAFHSLQGDPQTLLHPPPGAGIRGLGRPKTEQGTPKAVLDVVPAPRTPPCRCCCHMGTAGPCSLGGWVCATKMSLVLHRDVE